MMEKTASQLITQALRLINVPGRGARLSGAAKSEAMEALQDLLSSEATSSIIVPGIREHFFTLSPSKVKYTYGTNAGVDFRSDLFDDDPVPIKVEDGFLRYETSITDNELIGESKFENAGTWATTGGGTLFNNQARITGIGTVTQTLSTLPADGTTYTLKANVEITTGSMQLQLLGDAVSLINETLDASGLYSFDVVFSGSSSAELNLECLDAGDDVIISSVSLIERGKSRMELSESGSDYPINVNMDQKRWNRIRTKGNGGRPYNLLFNRIYPNSELWMDIAPETGSVLVLNVLADRINVTNLNDVLRVFPEEFRWLKYQLADDLSGEYSKSLSRDQRRILDDSFNNLAAANMRPNHLRTDVGLRGNNRTSFNINEGDY